MRDTRLCEVSEDLDDFQWFGEHTVMAGINDGCLNARIAFELFIELCEWSRISPRAVHVSDGNVLA